MDSATDAAPHRNGRTSDAWPAVDRYLSRLTDAIDLLSREAICSVVDVLLDAGANGRRIYLMGNGGSAATASHMANDLNKQCCVDGHRRFRAIALNDNIPTMLAWANDDDYASIFEEQLANHVEPGDVVVAISTSGDSPNVVRGVKFAGDAGAATVGFTGDEGGRLAALVDYCVYVPSDDIGHQEDVHLVLNHAIGYAIRDRLAGTS